MNHDLLDLAVDFIIFVTGLSLLMAAGTWLYALIEEMTETLIR